MAPRTLSLHVRTHPLLVLAQELPQAVTDTLDLGLDDPLALANTQVAQMTRPEREARVQALVQQSTDFLDAAIEQHITTQGRTVAATVVLYSGGNDSTVLAHQFRDRCDYAAHANTTIGIEDTRAFVRATCVTWNLPLIERTPPTAGDHYRALVLDQGFPGPAMHFKMYQRLKERTLRVIRNELVSDPRRERVVFLAGRRRTESERRKAVPISERDGSVVWVSPLVNWTKMDLNTYRLMAGDVPVNEVSDLIHMSGECLCGSFAAPGERDELQHWYPGAFDQITELETLLADRTDIPAERRVWGWGADPVAREKDRHTQRTSNRGVAAVLCSSCDDRFQSALF